MKRMRVLLTGLALMLAAACSGTTVGGAGHNTLQEHGTITNVAGSGFNCTWTIVRTKPDGKPDTKHPKNLYGQKCDAKPGAGYRLYKDGSVTFSKDVKFRYAGRHLVQTSHGEVCRVTYEKEGQDNQHHDLSPAYCGDRRPEQTMVFTIWTGH